MNHDKKTDDPQVILLNKPFHVLSQFSESGNKVTLAEYIKEPLFYPAGRLDFDSEGLLLLTNNGSLQSLIAHPEHKMHKTYLVQVEGAITPQAISQLTNGVQLKDGITLPARAKQIDPPEIWPRTPPIRERKAIPVSWIEITIHEGRNRQIRRMTAAVGFPTLRLIRTRIGPWSLMRLQPGESQQATIPSDILAKIRSIAVASPNSDPKQHERHRRYRVLAPSSRRRR